jgi:hypothetical protein
MGLHCGTINITIVIIIIISITIRLVGVIVERVFIEGEVWRIRIKFGSICFYTYMTLVWKISRVYDGKHTKNPIQNR